LQCVAVCCSVLQCVAVCCSVLQCVAVCCSVLHLRQRHLLASHVDAEGLLCARTLVAVILRVDTLFVNGQHPATHCTTLLFVRSLVAIILHVHTLSL